MATAEFSKFAGILSAALSQHHLLGFEIAQAGIPSPPLALFIVMLPKAHLTSPKMSGYLLEVCDPPGGSQVSDHMIVIIWVIKIFFV